MFKLPTFTRVKKWNNIKREDASQTFFFFFLLLLMSKAISNGLSGPLVSVGAGVAMVLQILVDQLTLSKPSGAS